ncbi:MAG: ATP-dependent sacrificial sulfur transferase LarE [Oscillospiraceae bacterium]
MQDKLHILKEYLSNLESVAVAFSNGVDSTFLLKVAHDVLQSKVIAITVNLNSFPETELFKSIEFCNQESIKQVTIQFDELNIENFSKNPPNRCYICKKAIFSEIKKVAQTYGIFHIVEGSNLDDISDYRPGLKAIEELNIKSPLRIAQFTKSDIRKLSHEMGLNTWDKPSFACLSSRFVYGETITKEKLSMVENAEEYLLSLGLSQVRVRVHGNMARIETFPQDFYKIVQLHEEIYSKLKYLGFSYITLDLYGYRTGSMNETLTN